MGRALALLLGLAAAIAVAGEHTVAMRNTGPQDSMVFEPAHLKVVVGDTVRFQAAHSGHYVRSLVVPDGAPVNLQQVREVAADKRTRVLMNGPRFDALLDQLMEQK